ncbi:hypothetical protein [Gottfriedia sp. OAE603]
MTNKPKRKRNKKFVVSSVWGEIYEEYITMNKETLKGVSSIFM